MTIGVKLSVTDPRDHILDDVIEHVISATSTDTTVTGEVSRVPFLVFDQQRTSMCVASSACTMKTVQDNEPNLNPYFLYNLRDDRTVDGGMSLRDVMTILYKYGIPTYDAYPVKQVLIAADNSSVYMSSDTLQNAALHKIQGYGRIRSLETLLKCFELNHNPGPYQNSFGSFEIVTAIYDDSMTFYKPSFSQSLGLINYNNENDHEIHYHCTTLIESVDMVNSRLKLQNSWGGDWGFNGTTWMTFAEWEMYVAECFYSVNNATLAATIKTAVAKSRKFKDYKDGDLEPDNQNEGTPLDMSFVISVDDPNDARIFSGSASAGAVSHTSAGCPNITMSRVKEPRGLDHVIFSMKKILHLHDLGSGSRFLGR